VGVFVVADLHIYIYKKIYVREERTIDASLAPLKQLNCPAGKLKNEFKIRIAIFKSSCECLFKNVALINIEQDVSERISQDQSPYLPVFYILPWGIRNKLIW